MDAYLALLNPAAGGGRCGEKARAGIDRLRSAGIEVDVVETTGPGHATAVARDARAEGRRRFIAVGGDGTSYEVINGLFPSSEDGDPRPVLGFLPLGTGNSFLRDFTRAGADHSIRAISEGHTRPCDVVRLTHRDGVLHYINIMSIGFAADVNALRGRRFGRFGETGYVFAVLVEVARLRTTPFAIAVDGGPMQRDPVTFISVNNSRYTGGKMLMAPDADTADGRVDLIKVGELGRVGLLSTFPKIFLGTHVHHPAVTAAQVGSIEFDIDHDIDVMIDGEAVRVAPRRIDVLSSALDVHV
jgi:YegS/Rv2252/BmrU family lipid kinase